MAKDVALLISCLTDQFYPRVGVAVTKILEHFGCLVHFPAEQTCCGRPFYDAGHHEQARVLARRMVEIFERYEYVVTPSASCCAMVRQNYPDLLAGEHAWESGCRRLALRTYEFLEFLDKVLRVDLSMLKLPQRRSVAYQHNCRLRSPGTADRSAETLREIWNLDLRPLPQADQCCGFGGSLALRYPAISAAIAADKADAIAATAAPIVICDDPGCALHISGACHARGFQTLVKHSAELIAEALAIDLSGW